MLMTDSEKVELDALSIIAERLKGDETLYQVQLRLVDVMNIIIKRILERSVAGKVKSNG